MSSVTLALAHPPEAIGLNEMPFGKDTRVVPSNIVLDMDPGTRGKEDFGVGTPSLQ